MNKIIYKTMEFFVDNIWGKVIVLMVVAAIGLSFAVDAYDCSANKHGIYVKQAFGFPVCLEEGKH
jgi:hypothetical protein